MNTKLKKTIEILNTKIFDDKGDSSIGLADGRMGLCIYFYYISRMRKSKEYTQKAESLMESIFEQIMQTKVFDIKNGLAGIGLGIDYLIENKFVEGNVNTILKEVDDELFRYLCNHDKLNNNDILLQLQLIYYFLIRLKKQNKNSENEYLFREVIINAINFLSEKIYSFFLDEPASFSIENPSILTLLVLSKCYELYKEKIGRILKDISFCTLSKIPVLHSNRLYLLYTMDKVNKKIETKGWKEHIKLLARESDIEYIIENELADDLYFSNGLSAIYYILSGLEVYFSPEQICKYKNLIINKIEGSPLWKRLIDDEVYLKLNNGLFSGYKGVSLLLHKHYKDENRLDRLDFYDACKD